MFSVGVLINLFKIDDFDFGIDATGSSFDLEDRVLTLEITGAQEVVERLSEDENHRWHWVLYAPKLYVRDLPILPEDSRTFHRTLTEEDYDMCEIGLYVGEHFAVRPCTISSNGTLIRVVGVIEQGLLDREVALEVEWDFQAHHHDRTT